MDKALNYLALARKGGMAELGEEPVGAMCRTGKAYLVLVASDASDHTWRRAKSYVAGTRQQCVRLPYSKDALGAAIGRTELAIAAITDAPLALALAQSLPDTDEKVLQELADKAQKLKQRKTEAKAHARNKAKGIK